MGQIGDLITRGSKSNAGGPIANIVDSEIEARNRRGNLAQQKAEQAGAEEARKAAAARQLFEDDLRRSETRLSEIGAQIPVQSQEFNAAIDANLANLLSEAGHTGDSQRRQIGAAFSDAGLLRSTGEERGILRQRLAEQEQKSSFVTDAQTRKNEVKRKESLALSQVQKGRDAARRARDISQIQAADNFQFLLNQANIEDEAQRALFELKLENQNEKNQADAMGAVIKTFTMMAFA